LFQNTLGCFSLVFGLFVNCQNSRAVFLEENAVFLPTFSRWGFGGCEGFGVRGEGRGKIMMMIMDEFVGCAFA
jgi:hypothetical protein